MSSSLAKLFEAESLNCALSFVSQSKPSGDEASKRLWGADAADRRSNLSRWALRRSPSYGVWLDS